jgi:hypothetical protein
VDSTYAEIINESKYIFYSSSWMVIKCSRDREIVRSSLGVKSRSKDGRYSLEILGHSPPIGVPAGFKLVGVRPTMVTPREKDTRREEKKRQGKIQ